MKIENLIAFRYFRSRKRNSILSFLSLTSIIGIMLGTAALILVVGVMSGFSDNLKEKMLGANADIVVTRMINSYIDNYTDKSKTIEQIKGVRGVTPFIDAQGVVTSESGVSGIMLKGIEPSEEKNVSRLESFIIHGSLDDLADSKEGQRGIILGKEFAFSIMAGVGDTITLISPNSTRGPFGISPKMRRFVVKGIFDTGVYEYNKAVAYISLKDAREFMGINNNRVTGFNVYVENRSSVPSLVDEINKKFKYKLFAVDWFSMNKSLFSALKLEQFAMFIVLTLIVIVSSFSIVSMLSITVKDKQRDIGILRAYGAGSSLIRKIFIKQGMLVGLIGTFLGNFIAFIISLLVTKYKLIKLPADVYFIDSLPIKMDLFVYLLVTVCAIIIIFFASLYPSVQASKVSPVQALRNE